MSDSPLIQRARGLIVGSHKILDKVQHPFLLLIRLYWGFAFFQSGYGKFGRIDGVTGYFTDLGIPLPGLNAYMAATTECVGGLFLLVGLASRLTAIPLAVTMIVALLTAHIEETKQIFSKPDAFLGAAPILFLLASLTVVAFGPGYFSIDRILAWKFKKPEDKAEA